MEPNQKNLYIAVLTIFISFVGRMKALAQYIIIEWQTDFMRISLLACVRNLVVHLPMVAVILRNKGWQSEMVTLEEHRGKPRYIML